MLSIQQKQIPTNLRSLRRGVILFYVLRFEDECWLILLWRTYCLSCGKTWMLTVYWMLFFQYLAWPLEIQWDVSMDEMGEGGRRRAGMWCVSLLWLHVAKKRKEGATQGERAQQYDRQLREGDYLVILNVSSHDECLRNERLRVEVSTFSQDLYISHSLRQERGGEEVEGG